MVVKLNKLIFALCRVPIYEESISVFSISFALKLLQIHVSIKFFKFKVEVSEFKLTYIYTTWGGTCPFIPGDVVSLSLSYFVWTKMVICYTVFWKEKILLLLHILTYKIFVFFCCSFKYILIFYNLINT